MKVVWMAKSVSVLVGVVILVLAIFGSSPISHPILITVAVLWTLAMLCFWCYKLGHDPNSWVARHRKEKQARKKAMSTNIPAAIEPAQNLQEEYILPDPIDAPLMLLLRHVSYRITESIHAAFPDANWNWDVPQPEKVIANGGTVRIKLSGAGAYTHANISVNKEANIQYELLQIVTLDQLLKGTAESEPASESAEIKSPAAWYDILGRKKIREISNELMTRGHKWLYLAENGAVIIIDGNGRTVQQELAQFPARKYWNELMDLMKSEGISVSEEENMIKVAFG